MASYYTPPKAITPTRMVSAPTPSRDDTVSIPRDPMQRPIKKVPANRNPGRFFSQRSRRSMSSR